MAKINLGQNFFGEKRFLHEILVRNILAKKNSDPSFLLDKKMHEFDAGGSARMSSSKIWDEHVTNEETKSHMEAS